MLPLEYTGGPYEAETRYFQGKTFICKLKANIGGPSAGSAQYWAVCEVIILI